MPNQEETQSMNQTISTSFADSSNPLYLGNSDHPGAILVSKKFDGTGYVSWRRSMLIAISAKKKQGFINGKIPEPEENDSSYEDWHACNFMLISWILNTLSKEISDSVIFIKTASGIWSDLYQRFGQSNGMSRLQLKREISTAMQGADSITNYFTRIKKLWDELQDVYPFPVSTKETQQYFEEEQLLQFLVGLNDSYSTTRGSIIMIKPLPSLSQAYSTLLHEEKQREVSSTPAMFHEQSSFNAHVQSQRQFKFDTNKSNLTCTYCKKIGHTREKCYHLIGFPTDFKFTKNKRVTAVVQSDETDVQSQAGIHLNNDQCVQLLSLLNQQKQDVPSSSKLTASSALKEVASAWHFKSDLRRLTDTMRVIQDVLAADDEDGHQIPGGFESLTERLKDTVYEADDLLDELTTLAERKRLTMSHGRFTKEVRTFFSGENQVATAFTVSSEIKRIRKALDDIGRDRQYASMVSWSKDVVERRCVVKGRETWSFVDNEDVIGREDEKQKILDVLLRDDCNDPAVVVLPIVGFGGLGKTTVAQFAFNDEGVKNHFKPMLWVCIGEVVGLKGIIRRIIMSATGASCPDDGSLDQLQNKVRGEIEGKRYLLVLDDIWDDDPLELSQLKSLLLAGDKGSRVLVTTRSKDIAKRLGTIHPLELQGLSDDASWTLFAKMAFESEQQKDDEGLVQIGKEIVKKCANSPLAIKVIGSLMRGKDIAQWRYFKDRDLAKIDTTDSIMPLLKLSYYRLKPQLRSCFTYCSLFPKDYEINKIKLCYLWMAQGFITSTPQSPEESLEDVAEQCFMELLQRCFFQDIQLNEWGEIESFKMHDLVHDLAQEVGKKEILLIDKDSGEIILDKGIRHLTTTTTSAFQLLDSPSFLHGGGNHLRTYLHMRDLDGSRPLVEVSRIICHFQRIKVLDLSNLMIKQLPESIGKLIHLRYLDLSWNKFEMLPKSITKLHNLETLNLVRCEDLRELPWDLSKLVNLRNLDLCYSPRLSYMPPGMGNLTRLRRLSRFVVGEGKSVNIKNGSGFDDLILLKNLGGALEIKIDRKVITGNTSVKTVKAGGCLLDKSNLTKLTIQLGSENETGDEESQDEELLLESLQPHSNLKGFTLCGYNGGPRFPTWMEMNNLGRALPNLVEIVLSGCERLQHIPILSQLPSLRSVRLDKLPSLEYVESKSYEPPTTSTSVAFFPSLKSLKLFGLPNVKGWWWPPPVSRTEPACDRQHDVAQSPIQLPSFPPLSELSIQNCPNMTSMPLCSHVGVLHLRNFNERLSVFMEQSPSSSSAPNPPVLETLDIDSIDYLNQLPKRCLPSLKNLSIYASQNVALSGRIFQHLTELVDLTIVDCPELALLAADEEENDELMPWKFLHRLRSLRLLELPKLETLPEGLFKYLTNLQDLQVFNCRNLLGVPDGIRGLTSLRSIKLFGCDGLKERCRKGTGEDWPKIQHIHHIILPDWQVYVDGNLKWRGWL